MHTFRRPNGVVYPGGLVVAPSGVLYGIAFSDATGDGDAATLYSLNGKFIYTVLYAFSGRGADSGPAGTLLVDGSGDIYGETTAENHTTRGRLTRCAPRVRPRRGYRR